MDHKEHLTIEGISSKPEKSRVVVVSFGGGSGKSNLSSIIANLSSGSASPDGEKGSVEAEET